MTTADRLRILFITEDDPLYVRIFFEVFLAEYPTDEFDLLAITIEDAFGESLLDTGRRVLRFYGPRDSLRQTRRFVSAQLRRRTIRALAEAADVPLLPARSVNDPEYVRRVRELAADVVVSVAAPEIFKPPLLEAPRLGCVNIHSGRLPVYRGMMPVFWQMRHGEPAVTVTIHEMVPKLDAGPVLATAPVAVRERDSLHRVMVEAKVVGARLMIDVLRDLAGGRAARMELDLSTASYFSFPQPSDVAALRARGHKML